MTASTDYRLHSTFDLRKRNETNGKLNHDMELSPLPQERDTAPWAKPLQSSSKDQSLNRGQSISFNQESSRETWQKAAVDQE